MNPQMRIGGLASGFDVGGTIAKIMELETKRVERLREQQELRNNRVTAWIDVKDNLQPLTQASDTLRWMDIWRRMASTSTNASVADASAAPGTPSGTFTVEVLQMARAQSLASATALTDQNGDPISPSTALNTITGISAGNQFAIGGQTFTIEASDTLATLRDKINTASPNMPESQRVTATILDNRLVLQRTETGGGQIALSDVSGNALAALGILDGVGNPANELIAGQDAQFMINGALITRSSNLGLTDVIDGITLNLRGLGTSEIGVGRDNEAIKTAINTFVDAYNTAAEVMEFYGTWDRSDPAKPLPGLLQDDSMTREMIYRFRGLMGQLMSATHTESNAAYSFNGTDGIMNSLQHIGIWTTGESNRLAIIDEDRLNSMLELYPEQTENLFRGVPDGSGARLGGIAQSLFRETRNYTSDLDGFIDFRIESINDEIGRQDDRIERVIRELEMRENMLWRQFGAMDEAIGRMQSGFEYLLGQIGSPSSGKRG
jgi:flagellar hook-associated protein 2